MEWKKQKANYRNKNERFNIGYRVRINQERNAKAKPNY